MKSEYINLVENDRILILTNINFDEILKNDTKIKYEEESINSFGWWLALDKSQRKVLRFEKEDIILGVFKIEGNDYFAVYVQGTGMDRNLKFYSLKNDISFSILSDVVKGKSYVVNEKKRMIAVQFMENLDNTFDTDVWEKIYFGVKVLDFEGKQIAVHNPTRERPHLIIKDFDDSLKIETFGVERDSLIDVTEYHY